MESIIEAAKAGKILIVASAMCIVETNKLDCQTTDPAQLAAEAAKIEAFFENDYILIRDVDRATAVQAASIARNFKITPKDDIHVATAIVSGCTCLQTYDG